MKTRLLLSFVGCALLSACGSDSGSDSQDNGNDSYSITLSTSSVSLKPEENCTIEATVTPTSSEAVIWTSSNEEVASVFYGQITAHAEGTATITASVAGFSATCQVEVRIPQYEMLWSDEFDGNELNQTDWTYATGGGGGNQEKQYYTNGENVTVSDGILTLTARKESYKSAITGITWNYTSARINTQNKVKFTYGKVEASISLPSGQGTWPAFWMMPNDSKYGTWPRSGEIDIMEHVGKDPTMISHAYHTKEANTSTGTNWSSKCYIDNAEGSFHTYTLEWEEGYLNGRDAMLFYVDGKRTGIKVAAENATWEKWPFDQDFYIILNLAMGGTWGGTIDDAIFNNPVEMKVDWVRVYQRK